MLTTHTLCLGGFCGPGGSQLNGNWSLEFQDAEEGESISSMIAFRVAFYPAEARAMAGGYRCMVGVCR